MKKDMPLEGLRWSRDSGSALYDTPQNGRSRTGWGENGLLGTSGKRLAIQSISGLLMVKPDEVFCCTFDEDTRLWHLRLANGQIHKLKKQTTAKAVLSLSPSLAQVRQDCIINLDYLISIENYTLRCIFSPPFDQENITVSRRCYKAVKEKLEIL